MNSNDLTGKDERAGSICRSITWRAFKPKLAQRRQKSGATSDSAHIFPRYLGSGIESATLGLTGSRPTFPLSPQFSS